MTQRKHSRRVRSALLSSVSAMALMAGCTGPFTPDGGLDLGLEVGPDGVPKISVRGTISLGDDVEVEKLVAPAVKMEVAPGGDATHFEADNVRYLYTPATIRDRPVDPFLMAQLSEIANDNLPPGTTINVTSGGQMRKGFGSRRTGSTRHDVNEHGFGGAVDFHLSVNGKKMLPGTHPEIYAKLIFEAGKTFPGIGHYAWGVHVGYGSPAFWGPDTTANSADPYLREAYVRGRQQASR